MRFKKWILSIMSLLFCATLATACGGTMENSSSSTEESTISSSIEDSTVSSQESLEDNSSSSSEEVSSEEFSSEESSSSSEEASSEEFSSEESSSSSEEVSSEEFSSEESSSSSEEVSSEEFSSEESSYSSEEVSSEEFSSEESSSSSKEVSSEEFSIEESSSSSEEVSSEEFSSEESSSSSEEVSSEEFSSEESSSSSEEVSSEEISSEESSDNEQDSSSSEEEDLKDFPVVNASTLVDFVVEVEQGRDPVVLMLSDTQIIDASQQHDYPSSGVYNRLNGAYSVLNTRWSRANVEDRILRYIREAVERSNPDLILLVGDNVYGEFDDSGYALQLFVEAMDSFGIPWAPVLGNHDSETAKGIAWLCSQYENAKYCLFKRNSLSGNGNYSIGITQGGKLVRTFFMLDSVTNTDGSIKPYGFSQDQIAWYTQSINAIKQASAPTKLSILTHVPVQATLEVLKNKYGYTNAKGEVLNLDVNGRDGDFGIANEVMGGAWDADKTVWNGWKSLGVDSVFFGHVHGCSIGVQYEGIQIQFGLKTGTYDALNYRTADGGIACDYSDLGDPITGATVIPVSRKDGSITPYHIETKIVEDATFNETLTVLEKDSAVTTIHITQVGAHSASEQNTLYLRFFDVTKTVHFLELPVGTNSTNNDALENFAKQIIFNGIATFNNVGVITSQQDTKKENFNVMFQLTGGANVGRFQYLYIPKGTTYECDADGNGKIDTVWTFDRDIKIVYDPYACTVRESLGGCNGSCDAGEWHIYTFEPVTTVGTVYEITSGSIYTPISSATNIGFQFISSSGKVNLGYTTTTWTPPDDASCEAFKKYIKINGNALPSTATLQGIDQTNALYLAGISLDVNGTITIEKGATFTHGDYTMIFTKTLTWTWTGETYTCTAT